MILCIGTMADQTFCHTVRALMSKNMKCDILDIGLLFLSGDIHLSFHDIDASFCINHLKYDFSNYKGMYARLVDISAQASSPALQKRASSFYQALRKFLSHIDIPVLNPPIGDQSNFTKLYHSVAIASANNWLMPRSCLTNNAETATAFIEKCNGVIYKGCSSVKTWARKLAPEDLERIELITKCPVLFQELVTGPDVRIHVVGEEAFAEKILSSSVDYRTIKGNQYESIDIPPIIKEGCLNLVKETATPFLGIDFKIEQNSNEWYFLEANNLPCYQGYDVRSGYKISSAITNWLKRNKYKRYGKDKNLSCVPA